MEERRCHQQGAQQAAPEPRRITRSAGGKDRHSKVMTAMGLRDRRVRLSAHTAIQFYDVQDRLGYDRPSKAVDWLIKKAGAAIAELPPCPGARALRGSAHCALQIGEAPASTVGYSFDNSYLLPPLDSDAITETIKSFFPIPISATMATPANYHNYPSQLLSYNTCSQAQEDLQLSLQSSHPHPITTMTMSVAGVDLLAANSMPGSWEDHSAKMAPWLAESSSLNAMLGSSSYRQLQHTDVTWIEDGNQLQIAQFGSTGFSNCFHLEEERHDDLPHK